MTAQIVQFVLREGIVGGERENAAEQAMVVPI
jgi:hypothetical protein